MLHCSSIAAGLIMHVRPGGIIHRQFQALVGAGNENMRCNIFMDFIELEGWCKVTLSEWSFSVYFCIICFHGDYKPIVCLLSAFPMQATCTCTLYMQMNWISIPSLSLLFLVALIFSHFFSSYLPFSFLSRLFIFRSFHCFSRCSFIFFL